MNRNKFILLFITTAIFAAVISLFFLFLMKLQIDRIEPKYDYLTLIVGILAIITTISVALSAYKAISTQTVKEIINQELGYIEKHLEDKIKYLNQSIKEIEKESSAKLADHLDKMILIAQSRANDVMTKFRINSQHPNIRLMVDYANEMNSEIIAILQMFVLMISSDAKQRLRGYQLLSTIPSKTISEYFMEKAKSEPEETNRHFIINELKSF